MFEINKIIGKKNTLNLFLLFIFLIIVACFEFIGIGTIPVLIGIVLDGDTFLNIINEYIHISWLQNISNNILLIYFSIFIVIIFTIKNLFQLYLIYFQGNLTKKIKIHIVSELFEKYLKSNFLYFLNKKSSVVIRTLNLDAGNTSIFILTYLNIIRELLIFIVICSLLLISNTLVSLYLIIFFLIFSLIFYFLTSKKLLKRGKAIQTLHSDLIKIITETFGAIKEIKILNLENFQQNIFMKKIHRNETYGLKNYIIKSLPRILLETISILAIIFIIVFYSFMNYDLTKLLPFLSLLTVCIIRLIPSLNVISNSLSTFKIILPSYHKIKSEFESSNNIANYKNNKKKLTKFDSIELKNINFKYNMDSNEVFKDFSIKINSNDKIGIVGKSGSGKTTLVNILTGLLSPSSGKIIINDKEVKLDEYSWSNLIGYVPQDIYLIDDTIKNNIAFGIDAEDQDEEILIKSSKSAQIHNYIDLLSKKYDSLVGENGVNFSIGQKQRIGIARALYRKSSILVLDESTSSLDWQTEKQFVDEIFSSNINKTIIFISHKLSALEKCDKIFDLDQLKFIKNKDKND